MLKACIESFVLNWYKVYYRTREDNNVIIKADKKIYSKIVLLKTAFTFTDHAYLHLSQDSDSWVIQWTEKEGENISPQEFENELIQQQIREKLLEQSADIRKILLARAFASTIIDAPVQPEEEEIMDENPEEAGNILKGWFDEHDPV